MRLGLVALTVVAAGVVAGVLDARRRDHRDAAAVLERVIRRGDRVALAASAYAELLIGPAGLGTDAVRTVDDFLTRIGAAIVAIDAAVAQRAAAMLARHTDLQPPGAFVLAAAEVAGATAVVTNEWGWPRARALRLPYRIERFGAAA